MPNEVSIEEVVNVLRENGFVIRPDDVALIQRFRNGGEVTFVYVVRGGVVVRFAITKLDGKDAVVLGPEFLAPKPWGVVR